MIALRRASFLLIVLLIAPALLARAGESLPWMVLPPTPMLPAATRSGLAPVNGIKLWFAEFGDGDSVILLHGGLANSDYLGLQVRALQHKYHVIVMDSRGHGRSSRTDEPLGYDLMASDVIALMDYLHIQRAAIAGWSDGAIVALDLAIHHPERIRRVFSFAANSDPSGVKDVKQSPVFTAFMDRAAKEYVRLSPTPKQFAQFSADVQQMWETQPHFTAGQLKSILVPVWIVDADHDEAIKRENTDYIFSLIPDAEELILPGVSHFAFLQNPAMFNYALNDFLQASLPRPSASPSQ